MTSVATLQGLRAQSLRVEAAMVFEPLSLYNTTSSWSVWAYLRNCMPPLMVHSRTLERAKTQVHEICPVFDNTTNVSPLHGNSTGSLPYLW